MATIEFKGVVERTIGDGLAITFSWPRASATFTYSVSVDGGTTFITGVETIAAASTDVEPRPEYVIPYSSTDRPEDVGTVVYIVSDGTDTGTIHVTVAKVRTSQGNYTDLGPKRVKTKEMEIEQFDPMTIKKVQERTEGTLPVFSDSQFQVAFPKCPRTRNPNG